MMENEALQVIQKMNVKINGTLHDVKKGTLYTCSNCGTRLGWGPNAARLANYCHGCGQKIDWKGTPRE